MSNIIEGGLVALYFPLSISLAITRNDYNNNKVLSFLFSVKCHSNLSTLKRLQVKNLESLFIGGILVPTWKGIIVRN
jgi:hypothetical protein